MSKAKGLLKKKGGPYLAAAFFCETTIEDKEDSALSAIRLIDQVTVTLPPSAPADYPSTKQMLPVQVAALVSFKTGNSPGDHTVRIDSFSPSGKTQTVFEKTVPLTPLPSGGANIRLNSTILVKEGGLFWMYVFLDGKEVTRMPLLISIRRSEEQAGQSDQD